MDSLEVKRHLVSGYWEDHLYNFYLVEYHSDRLILKRKYGVDSDSVEGARFFVALEPSGRVFSVCGDRDGLTLARVVPRTFKSRSYTRGAYAIAEMLRKNL